MRGAKKGGRTSLFFRFTARCRVSSELCFGYFRTWNGSVCTVLGRYGTFSTIYIFTMSVRKFAFLCVKKVTAFSELAIWRCESMLVLCCKCCMARQGAQGLEEVSLEYLPGGISVVG